MARSPSLAVRRKAVTTRLVVALVGLAVPAAFEAREPGQAHVTASARGSQTGHRRAAAVWTALVHDQFSDIRAGGGAAMSDASKCVVSSWPERPSKNEGSTDAASNRATRRSTVGVISGRVTDLEGAPLARASVTAARIGFGPGGLQVSSERTSVTNAEGEYTLTDVRAGQYYVAAVVKTPGDFTAAPTDTKRSPDKTPDKTGYAPTFHPGVTSAAAAARVTVQPEQTVAGVDIVLEKRRLARVSGSLVSTREKLQDGAHVTLALSSGALGPSALQGFLGVTRPTANGRFQIDGVPPGEYVLMARSVPQSVVNEIATTGRSAPLTRDPEAEYGMMTITVSEADLTDLIVPLTTGGIVKGRVLLDQEPLRPRGSVVSVTAAPGAPDAAAGGATQTPLEHDGTFELRGLSGTFVLRVGATKPPPPLLRIERSGLDVTDTGIVVGRGETVTDVAIALDSNPTRLVGQIRVDDKDPAHACTMVVFSQDATRWSWPATRYVRAAPVDGGVARIVGLPPGAYLAIAVDDADDGRWRDPAYLKTLAGSAMTVRLGQGETKTIDLSSDVK
jgi:hypothetical protein